MEGGNDFNMEKSDEILLPGFRFHPTDEELVSFYLKKKIQQKPISIELIRQLDIYKFDPWDLPKLASTGETEWYFYCPRDRKYRNSARPNRVTAAGFWKATGTDRPIYSSEGTRCIGLKKSLVFYRGRAARGMKTDWMMHEFRLPSLADPKKPIGKNIPLNDSWTICKIFKKTGSMAQRALNHTWGLPMPGATKQDDPFSGMQSVQASHFAASGSSSQQAATAPHKYGFQGQQQHFQKPSNTQAGSSCKVISFNSSPPPLQVQKGPVILPFQTQLSQKPAQDTPHLFDPQFGQPEQIARFVVDSSSDINAGMNCTNQESSTIKPGSTLSMNNGWVVPGKLNVEFDLGADSSDDWKCNIPWESFLSPTVSVG
uniref:Uncharacterized protein n=1 Tax=Avena sativa TaxID=4498 RepID=A0ACD5V3Z3_AVESA